MKESADSGISNNPAPLPEKVPEPVGITIFPLTNKLPLNIEPLAIEVTTNPLFGLTEAVTLPLAINVAVKAGILNNWEPSPIKKDADTLPLTTTFPINLEPLSIEVTTNPVLGETEAVTLPLDIKVAVNAGILINWEPSPIKNDADTLPLTTTFPIKVEPLWDELTINPVFGATDAVTEPDLISVDINASDVKAERGISDNPAPLPLKNPLPVGMVIFPTVVTLPLKVEPLSIEITKNPVSGVTDAVIEPVANWVVSNASGVKAERGMFVNPAPLPLKNPLPVGIVILPLTTILPLNVEPLAIASTKNPLLGDTDAVILPLAILKTSAENADNGILNNPSPLPVNADADTVVFTNKPVFGAIDAVTLPLAILLIWNAKDDSGISNNPLPLPVNIDADTGNWNVENVFTTNPVFGAIDAVTEPLPIKVDVNAGMFVNPLPSPLKLPLNEPLNEPVKFALPINEPLNEPVALFTVKTSLIPTEPVSCWLSELLSPNILEPDE